MIITNEEMANEAYLSPYFLFRKMHQNDEKRLLKRLEGDIL